MFVQGIADIQDLSIVLIGRVQTCQEQCEFEVVFGDEALYQIHMIILLRLRMYQLANHGILGQSR